MVFPIFYYYCFVGFSSLIVNTFNIYASINVVRGEFKWVFLGSSLANIFLSLSQLVIMSGSLYWSDSQLNLIVSHNPFFDNRPALCTSVYVIFYIRQLEASALCLCLVSLNRACSVVWRSGNLAPAHGKKWALFPIIPNVFTFLMWAVLLEFPGTSLANIEDQFPPAALAELKKDGVIMCALTSQFESQRDTLQTIFFLLCPVISYPVTLVCVLKLLVFVHRSQRNVRANVSQSVIKRQKGILATICVQSIGPLIFYAYIFVSMMYPNQSIGDHEWHTAHLIHFLAAICPLADALATIICLKSFRKALPRWPFCRSGAQVEPNLHRRISEHHVTRPPSRRDPNERFDVQLPGSTVFLKETRV